jgi:MATE family multidrug resistance protein
MLRMTSKMPITPMTNDILALLGAAATLKLKVATKAAILKDKLIAIITLGLPVKMTCILKILPGIVTLVLVGWSGGNTKLYVNAAALSVMFFNIVGLSTAQGFFTALDTLCSSAHGAHQPAKMGRYLLMGIVVMTAMSA